MLNDVNIQVFTSTLHLKSAKNTHIATALTTRLAGNATELQ